MSTVQITSYVSFDELLHGVEQLNLTELEQFVFRVLSLQAQRKSPSLPRNEAKLLLKINQGLPSGVQKRYDELTAKRQAETLTSDEHQELLRLVDRIEKLDADRVKHLAELSRLRVIPLTTLMQDLGIRTPAYA